MANYDIYQLSQHWKNVKGVFGEFKNKIDLKLSEIESFERNKDALLKESYDKGCDEQLEKDSGTIEQLIEDKENAYKEGYEAGKEMAWGTARKLLLTPERGGASYACLSESFGNGMTCRDVLEVYTVDEVKAKLDKWDNKCNDTVVVGDEVTTASCSQASSLSSPLGFSTFVVTVVGDDRYYGIDEFGTSCGAAKSVCKKTGRHFKELDDLFLAMGKPAEAE